jgi:hypothetical protein
MITLRMYSIVRQTATSDVHCYHRSQTSDRGLDAYGAVSRWVMDILQFVHKLAQQKNRASKEYAVFLG